VSDRTKIEWTEATWNPVTGCTKVSPGCEHCYAERFAERFRGVPGHPYEQGFDVRIWPDRLSQPFRWKRPRLVFVNSMSDLFHPLLSKEFIGRVLKVIEQTPQHTYQVLTKRPARMAKVLSLFSSMPLPNLWLGTSIELDRFYWRADQLRETQAAIRFLSLEPLLGALPRLKLEGIGWVIVGGESGPGHRPIEIDWVRDLRDRCRAARIPFFFKQWGGARPTSGGRLLDGRTWDDMPHLLRSRVSQTPSRQADDEQ
jgi:protein gp37